VLVRGKAVRSEPVLLVVADRVITLCICLNIFCAISPGSLKVLVRGEAVLVRGEAGAYSAGGG